jgi:hypothetical protein
MIASTAHSSPAHCRQSRALQTKAHFKAAILSPAVPSHMDEVAKLAESIDPVFYRVAYVSLVDK